MADDEKERLSEWHEDGAVGQDFLMSDLGGKVTLGALAEGQLTHGAIHEVTGVNFAPMPRGITD